MKINNTLTPDENIMALVKNSNPELKDGVVVGDAVHLDGVGPNNSAITLTPSVDGVYKTSEPVTVKYTRRNIEEYVDVVSPIEVPLDTLDVEGHVVQQAMLFPESAHFFESLIDEDAKNVLITPTTAASKLIVGDATVNYTLQEEPVETGEPLILHSQGDIDLTAPVGSILYSADGGETWHVNTDDEFTVSLPSGIETSVYLKSNDDVELTETLEVTSTGTNTNNFKGVESWWESSRPIRLNVTDNSFYVPKVAPLNVTRMWRMFHAASAFNGDISQWDVSNVTDMSGMFYECRAFNQDLSTWDTSSVTDMSTMFSYAMVFNGDISTWDVSNVTDMSNMFNRADVFNGDLSQWDTSLVTDMSNMFWGCASFNQDLSSWCVSKITTKPTSFDYVAKAWTLPRPVWGTCPPRAEEPGAEEPLVLHSQGDIDLKAPVGSILYSVDEEETWQENAAANFTVSLPSEVESTVYIKSNDDVELTEVLTVRPTDTNTSNFKGVHQWWESSRPIRLNVSDNSFYVPKVAPSNVTTMSDMFWGSSAFNQDLSRWDTSSVTNMEGMFGTATSFNSDISQWDVSNVTNMSNMFRTASAFNGDISNWDTSSVTDMSWMFDGSSAFNQDISTWDVSNVTDMSRMFRGARSFNQDLSSWCVGRIGTKPSGFDSYDFGIMPQWTLPKPVWGTCPARG